MEIGDPEDHRVSSQHRFSVRGRPGPATDPATSSHSQDDSLKQFASLDFSFRLALWVVRSPFPWKLDSYRSTQSVATAWLRFAVGSLCMLGIFTAPVFLLVQLRTQVPTAIDNGSIAYNHWFVSPNGAPTLVLFIGFVNSSCHLWWMLGDPRHAALVQQVHDAVCARDLKRWSMKGKEETDFLSKLFGATTRKWGLILTLFLVGAYIGLLLSLAGHEHRNIDLWPFFLLYVLGFGVGLLVNTLMSNYMQVTLIQNCSLLRPVTRVPPSSV